MLLLSYISVKTLIKKIFPPYFSLSSSCAHRV